MRLRSLRKISFVQQMQKSGHWRALKISCIKQKQKRSVGHELNKLLYTGGFFINPEQGTVRNAFVLSRKVLLIERAVSVLNCTSSESLHFFRDLNSRLIRWFRIQMILTEERRRGRILKERRRAQREAEARRERPSRGTHFSLL